MTDLWPDDVTFTKQKAPVTILREQASLLGTKTKNLVIADVKPELPGAPDSGYVFSYGFYIVAPALQNYRYKLFSIKHDVQMYPVSLFIDQDIMRDIGIEPEKYNRAVAQTEEEFIGYLQHIFNAQKTKQVIQAILIQSEGYVPEN